MMNIYIYSPYLDEIYRMAQKPEWFLEEMAEKMISVKKRKKESQTIEQTREEFFRFSIRE